MQACVASNRSACAVPSCDGMKLFCDGLAGRFFNRCGTAWPDVDVTIVDLSIFAREGYEVCERVRSYDGKDFIVVA